MTRAIAASSWNVHAVLIEHRGRLAYEQYFAGTDQRWGDSLGRVVFDRNTKHDLRSVSKSVVSALIGTLVTSGAIRSLDTPIVQYFPEYKDLQTPERSAVTLRHALTMTAGLEWNEEIPYSDPRNDEIRMTRSPDPLRFALDRPIVAKPGTVWSYNGGLTQVLATVIERLAKTPLTAYAEQKLFKPLGISDFEWVGNLGGVPAAASGVRLRPRDLAKFGSMYAARGRWRNRQIVGADWVAASLVRRVNLPGQTAMGYGYQWWHQCLPTPAGTVEMQVAAGNGGQRIAILPAADTVVTILAGRYNEPTPWLRELIVHQLLPAFRKHPAGPCSTEPSAQ
jgi:CubicO group peptidase (beta-lactamase class C family)